MLNAILYLFVFGFVALAVLGHVLVFVAIAFGRSQQDARPFVRPLSWFRRASVGAA